MQASLFQIILVGILVLSILTTSIYAYFTAVKHDKLWFYVYSMMLIIIVQWMSDTGASLIFHNYYLHLASIIFFPSVVFSLFVVHFFQGKDSSRQMLYTLLVGEIGYAISIIILAILQNTPSYITLNSIWIRNHLFSSLAIIADYFLITILWQKLSNIKLKIPLFAKVWLVCFVVLVSDSHIFTFGTFWGNAHLQDMINANFVIRAIISFLITPFITIYFKLHENELGWQNVAQNNKIFELEKMEKEQEEQRKAILNILEDVEDEKNKVISQADTLRKFETAALESNEMLVFTDSDGIVEWVNKATETVTGFTVAEAVGKKAGVLWGKLMPKIWYEKLWQTIKIEKKLYLGEIDNHRKNGEKFTSVISIYPLLDANNEVKYFVATQRDITQEKAISQMKTDFISLASHQLRTPLSAMKWFLEMLQAGDLGKLSKQQSDAIDNIEQSNDRMIALVNGLLNISRIDSGRIIVEPTMTNITTVINNTVSDISQKLKEKDQTIMIEKEDQIPELMLDAKLIGQVILNLLTNAIKYSKKSTQIKLVVSKTIDSLQIEVKDSGYGIPKTDQPKLFNRFFRASNIIKLETDGTGLGLYLAKAIVESSGGKIWFNSIEGEGSSFFFTIPLAGMKPHAGEVRLSKEEKNI